MRTLLVPFLFIGAMYYALEANAMSSPLDEEQPNNELAERVDQAQAVVSGVVTDIAPYTAGQAGAMSMKDPQWYQATIQVDNVAKGSIAGKTIQVLFSSSQDIAWSRAPKLKKGDSAVWLLQTKDPFGRSTPGLAVVSPTDRQPTGDLPKLQAMIKKK
jgi:hypothetical protein